MILIRADHLTAVKRGIAWKRALAIGLSSVLLLGAVPSASAAEHADIRDKLLNLGAGPLGGGSRPVGEALCDVVNADRRTTHVRCVAIGTAGSSFNLESVMSGRLLMGLAQEDLVHQTRLDPKQSGAQALRVVAVTHEAPIAVVVGPQSGITDLQQLAGKRVNMGSQGSDQFMITQALLAAMNLRADQLAAASYLSASAPESSLCGNEVDVVVKAVAHPSPLLQRLLACGGRFLYIPPVVAAPSPPALTPLRGRPSQGDTTPAGGSGPAVRAAKGAPAAGEAMAGWAGPLAVFRVNGWCAVRPGSTREADLNL